MAQTNFNSRNEAWVKRKKHITATETGFNADAFGFKLGLFKGFAVDNKPKVQKHQRRENAWTARQGRGRIHYGDAAHALCRRNLHSKTNRPYTIRPSSFAKSSGLLLQVS